MQGRISSASACVDFLEPNPAWFVEPQSISIHMGTAMRSIPYAMQLAAVGLAFNFLVSPVYAVTCEEVQALPASELSNWAKRLKVKPAELTALLELSFCAPTSERPGVIVTERKGKAVTRTSSPL
jgi:hypothetical protein